MSFDAMKIAGEVPEWMTEEGYTILKSNYLLPNETPRAMYDRIASAVASYYSNKETWRQKFFDVMWKNWLCPASPILANMGTTRALPISCYSSHLADQVDSIFSKVHEVAMLSKHGGGTGIFFGDVRGRGAPISGNGQSEGVVGWLKVYDSTLVAVSQGSVRRAAGAVYLPIEHRDAEEFFDIRRATGDVNRRCANLNHGVTITDAFMRSLDEGNKSNRHLWRNLLKARVETGQPYMLFVDTVNRLNPDCYKANALKVVTSNLCSEITLHTDPDHSFVCCLSSLNLTKWEEWKDTDLPQVTTRFLDAVMSEFIQKSEGVPGLDCARRSAVKGRAIGIGVLGWHTLLQQRGLPFDSFGAMLLNAEVFKTIRKGAEAETAVLAQELGEPEWCKGFSRRNTHLIAIAPTVSNSAISGGHSAGIEPLAANAFTVRSATGTFFRYNPQLQSLLKERGGDDPETWKSIIANSGSVQHLDAKLLSDEEKQVFLTAREINQHALVKQAAQRQQYVDQAQSLNLFFAKNATPRYIHDVHMAAWQSGVKSLYYLRTEGVLRGDLATRSKEECAACEA